MRITILSRAARSYSTRRLREAAREAGLQAEVKDTLQFAIALEQQSPFLLYRGRRFTPPEAVIPRIGASVTTYGTAVVRQFQQMNVFVANTANAIGNSRDKLRALQILSRHDIGMAATLYVRQKRDILPAINRVGGAPVIIKLMQGTQGMGVILAETTKVAEAIVEAMHGAKQNVLIQKFVAESKGRDIRAFVVGDQVVAAMRRVAQGQEFRSNVHLGAKAERVELEPVYAETAVRSARILGLRVAGVDMLETATGPQVIEVNSSPGLQGIESATGINVAGAIMDYVRNQVNFPELDLRERLTVASGQGVAELVVGGHGELAGRSLGDLGLREKGIVVLTIDRAGDVTTNPRSSFIVREGDHLLCFGDLNEIRLLLPPAPPRRRRRSR